MLIRKTTSTGLVNCNVIILQGCNFLSNLPQVYELQRAKTIWRALLRSFRASKTTNDVKNVARMNVSIDRTTGHCKDDNNIIIISNNNISNSNNTNDDSSIQNISEVRQAKRICCTNRGNLKFW